MTNESNEDKTSDAASGQDEPVVMCWQSMDSAPKDGTYILVSSEGVGTWVAKYVDRYISGFVPKNKWQSMMLNHNHIRDFSTLVPTHWMLLPNALNT